MLEGLATWELDFCFGIYQCSWNLGCQLCSLLGSTRIAENSSSYVAYTWGRSKGKEMVEIKVAHFMWASGVGAGSTVPTITIT
eukprot:5740996-Amphidinium_carterae.1